VGTSAAAPNFLHLLKSFELPGGFKFELRKTLRRIAQEAEKEGPLPEDDFAQPEAPLDIFRSVPVLAQRSGTILSSALGTFLASETLTHQVLATNRFHPLLGDWCVREP
jgi:hypothetical protein